MALKNLCVFCGSNAGLRPVYRRCATDLGTALARRGMGLIYGGGNVGLMGAVADAALAAGGTVVGIIPQALVDKELAHAGLSDLRVVGSMHARKAEMAARADAFVALPGGYGTFEEFIEVLTWAQLGIHSKPCGLLNVEGYFDPLLAMFDHALAEGFLRPEHHRLVLVHTEVEELLDALASYHPDRPASKWLDRSET
ncbi:MAG TPA: TIGR00730 family Rossman fold protein [Chthonomonadaceae bacterium]|nr:TIGR00730 family Rossman fold protein [Chthonomonadaceae bacterium]